MAIASIALICIAIFLNNIDAKPPNIIFILADDLGFHDVGYHGSEIKTPTIDGLAASGVRLENYYVQPICSPTRSQLLSGRYQIHTGLQHGVIRPSQPNALPSYFPTIADKLRDNGYKTHMVGKWHIGFYKDEFVPTNRGFDSFYGYLTGGEDYYTHHRCFEEECGLDLRDNLNPVKHQTGVYSTHLFAQRAINIISEHNSTKPLFLYLPFQAVHAPLMVPDHYTRPYAFIKNEKRRIYAGMTSCLDEAIGNITTALKEKELLNDTLIIFSTDNGGNVYAGASNWPLRGWKGSLWEGGVHGVGFVAGSLLKKPKRKSRELMHVSDWYPTLLRLAGDTTTKDLQLDGFDIWDSISEGKPSPRKELLHNIDPLVRPSGARRPGSAFDNRIRASVRQGIWKLLTGNPGNGSWIPPPHLRKDSVQNIWLFDIGKDPNEKNDLSESFPDVVDMLLGRLAFYNGTAVSVRYPPFDPKSNPKYLGGVWGPWVE